MKLYEIEESRRNLLLNEDLSLNELEAYLSENIQLLEGKLGDILAYAKEQELSLTAYEEQLKKQLEAVKSSRKRIEGLQSFVATKMQVYGLDELKSKHFLSVKLVNSGGIRPLIIKEDVEVSSLPTNLKMIIQRTVPNKEEIRACLEAGEVLDFAYLGEKTKILKVK